MGSADKVTLEIDLLRGEIICGRLMGGTLAYLKGLSRTVTVITEK
jgi:hypothetical protein